jgi:hypothetical protein
MLWGAVVMRMVPENIAAVSTWLARVDGLGQGKHHGVSRDACKLAGDGGEGVVAAGEGPPVATVTMAVR